MTFSDIQQIIFVSTEQGSSSSLFSIVAFITGLLAIIITVIRFSREQARLKILIDPTYLCFFYRTHNDEDTTESPIADAMLPFVIHNRSIYPINITGISITSRNVKKNHTYNPSLDHDALWAVTDKQVLPVYCPKKISLPLRISPFDTECIQAYFPSFGTYIKNDSQKVKVKVKFETSRKTIPRRITVEEKGIADLI